MKNSDDNIRNRTRDLPAHSTVPQPTAPLQAPDYTTQLYKLLDQYATGMSCLIIMYSLFNRPVQQEACASTHHMQLYLALIQNRSILCIQPQAGHCSKILPVSEQGRFVLPQLIEPSPVVHACCTVIWAQRHKTGFHRKIHSQQWRQNFILQIVMTWVKPHSHHKIKDAELQRECGSNGGPET